MKRLTIISLLFLTGCASGHYHDYLRIRDIAPPTPSAFTHCYNYGCQKRETISLPTETLNCLKKNFTPTPKNAEEERQKIATSIKIFEEDIGTLVGTKNDKRGTFRLYQDNSAESRKFQQDCIDESTNTTIYIGLLEELNLIHYHRAVFPANRQPFLSGAPWWHQTAVMEDNKTGEKYAVDSWFRDNGHSAFIVPLSEWKAGWMAPKDKEVEK